jgi:hypothetical protein
MGSALPSRGEGPLREPVRVHGQPPFSVRLPARQRPACSSASPWFCATKAQKAPLLRKLCRGLSPAECLTATFRGDRPVLRPTSAAVAASLPKQQDYLRHDFLPTDFLPDLCAQLSRDDCVRLSQGTAGEGARCGWRDEEGEDGGCGLVDGDSWRNAAVGLVDDEVFEPDPARD